MFLTHQQIFDTVARHLLTQLRPSLRHNNLQTCAYRGEDNTMCALGALITDEAYIPAIECQVPSDYNNTRFQQNPLFPVLHNSGVSTDSDTLDLLNDLQEVHDDYADVPHHPALRELWSRALTQVARDHSLDPQAIVEANHV